MSGDQEFNYNQNPSRPPRNNKILIIAVVLIAAAMILLMVAAWNAVSYFGVFEAVKRGTTAVDGAEDGLEEDGGAEANEVLNKYIETFRNSRLEEALKKDASAIDYFDENYYAPLYYAIYSENTDAVSILLKYGADMNLTDDISDYGSPLEFAIRCGNMEAFEFLLEEGAELESKNSYGMTPFIYAASREEPEFLSMLYEAGAKVDEQDYYDWNALHYAARYGRTENYKNLLTWGVPEDLITIQGYNMAHVSLQKGDMEHTGFLLERGFELTQPTDNGEYLIHLAGSDEAFRYIIENYEYDLNSKDGQGNSFLHFAQSMGLSGGLIREMLKEGADPNLRNSKGATPLMYSVKDLDLVKLLLEFGADKAVKDVDGDTAYDYLDYYYEDEYDPEVVELLK